MQHIEFLILCALLIIVLRRMPFPWRANMINVLILKKLNRIEARLRQVPAEEIDKELGTEIEAIEYKEAGRPWFADRYWERFPTSRSN